jgi:hypothetical protein
MKVLTEYEPSDIKMDGFAEGEKMDPVTSFLMVQFMVVGLTGFTPRPTDDPDDKMIAFKRLIADFLNAAQKSGISITKSELPAAYSESKP